MVVVMMMSLAGPTAALMLMLPMLPLQPQREVVLVVQVQHHSCKPPGWHLQRLAVLVLRVVPLALAGAG